MPTTSAEAGRFTESVIREMTRLALQHGAVNLAQGFPDFACPPELKAAADYAMCRTDALDPGADDVAFARRLVAEAGVACVPGSSFFNGAEGSRLVRFAFPKRSRRWRTPSSAWWSSADEPADGVPGFNPVEGVV